MVNTVNVCSGSGPLIKVSSGSTPLIQVSSPSESLLKIPEPINIDVFSVSQLLKVSPASRSVSILSEPIGIDIYSPAGPPGPQGPPGAGLLIKGTVPSSANLPATGNLYGDLWIAQDTGHGWLWETPGIW